MCKVYKLVYIGWGKPYNYIRSCDNTYIQEIVESLHVNVYSEPYKGGHVHQSKPLEWVTYCKDFAISSNVTHSKGSDWWTWSTLMFYLLQTFRNLLYAGCSKLRTSMATCCFVFIFQRGCYCQSDWLVQMNQCAVGLCGCVCVWVCV